MVAIPKTQPVRSKDYLDFVRNLPCVVCENFQVQQKTKTEAAHTGAHGLGQGRGSSKLKLREAIKERRAPQDGRRLARLH